MEQTSCKSACLKTSTVCFTTRPSALPAFVRGTPLLATAPGLLLRHTLQGLASCPPPVACPAVLMYLIWYARYQQDPAHRWLRAQLEAVVAPALAHDALT